MDPSAVDRLYDCDVLDRHGRRIGTVRGLWLAEGSGVPRWAAVCAGAAEVFVPLRGGQVRERGLVLPIEQREVVGAPSAEGGSLDVERAHDHYGLTVPDERLVRHERAVSASSSPAPRVTPPAR